MRAIPLAFAAAFLVAPAAAFAEEADPILDLDRAAVVKVAPRPIDQVRRVAAQALEQRMGVPGAWLLAPRAQGTFRLAVVPVEFKDARRDTRFTDDHLRRALFSRGEYTGESPSGERVFGSLADYYAENSCGRFALEGDVLKTAEVRAPRADIGRMFAPLAWARFLGDALASLSARAGADALDSFDAVAFVIAGDHGPPASVLWPHANVIPYRGRLLRYYVMSEKEGGKFAAVGVHCHEFGHVLGILDKYGVGHPAGVGVFCVMAIGGQATGSAGRHRPLHFCAVCKEKLGWLDPVTVDPRVAQRLRLRGVEGRPGEALKVLVSKNGSEYFLLENRRRAGFDSGFPRAGLLIWHVGEWGQRLRNRLPFYDLDLEEAHGQDGRDGPFKDLARVPFPLPGANGFTPQTKPSSRSVRPGALPVWITEIAEDGESITLRIGRARRAGWF